MKSSLRRLRLRRRYYDISVVVCKERGGVPRSCSIFGAVIIIELRSTFVFLNKLANNLELQCMIKDSKLDSAIETFKTMCMNVFSSSRAAH